METNVEQKINGEVSNRNCYTRNASFETFPEEIHIEILSRLPPESLARCKCVSKHWKNTLTIQAFWFRHNLSFDRNPKLAFVVTSIMYGWGTGSINYGWGTGSIISFELNDDNTPKTNESRIRGKNVYFTDFYRHGEFIYMSNICNDLICLFNLSSVGLLSIRTGDLIQLPAITLTSGSQISRYTLGFDPENKVFKVLSMIYCCSEERITKAVILTIGSKHWKPIDCKFLLSKTLSWEWALGSTDNSISVDGMIYWVQKKRICDFFVLTVVAFDFSREEFRDYELVKTPIKDGDFVSKLTSSKGCPTLLLRKNESNEIQEWTLFNHKKSNATWNWKSFTLHDNKVFPSGYKNWTSVTGGSFLLREVSVIQDPQEHDDPKCSYFLFDLEVFAMETILGKNL